MRGDSRPTPNNVVPIRGSPVIDVTPEEAGFPDVSADPFPMASPQQAQKLVDLGFGDTEDDVLNSFFNREK